jgi:hypothetical protein
MKQILARLTPLVWHLFVGADDGVADCAFGLAFEGAGYVFAEGGEAGDYAAVLWGEGVLVGWLGE